MSSITYNDCKDCPHIHKKYLSEEKLAFNASCGLCIVKNDEDNTSFTKLIAKNKGMMLAIKRPDWCPLLNKKEDAKEEETANMIRASKMSYQEKREYLLSKHSYVTWKDIKEGSEYVIPQWEYTKTKRILIEYKTDNLIRYHEIDENGKKSTTLSFIYPTEEKLSLLVEYHNF